MRPSTRRTVLALAGALALAAAIVALLAGSSRDARTQSTPVPPPSGFDGAALPGGGLPAPAFALRDQSGRTIALPARGGAVTVLAFLSSGCGAPCVLIAQQLRGALDQLGRAAAVLLVSVDPRRDTPARVRGFLARASLSGRVSFLGGSVAELAPVWRAYRISAPAAGPAATERAATIVLIDARGRERVLFGLEQLTPESLAHDIARLQGRPNPG